MKEKQEASYYSIIPASVRYDNRLNASEKLMYAEITALTNFKGYCWATNSYFASLYGVSIRTVSRWVNALRKYGYIKVELIIDKETKEVTERRIRLTEGGMDKIVYTYRHLGAKPIDKNVQDNNTRGIGSAHSKNEQDPYDPLIDIAEDLED